MTNSNLKFSACTSLACFLFLPSFHAQQSAGSAGDVASNYGVNRSGRMKKAGAALKATDLMGMKIENTQGQKIGKVDDLAIDLKTGRVLQLIVSAGGLLSVDRHVAVPPGQLHYADKDKPLHFDITPERLKSAPAFEMSRWSEFYQSDRTKESDRYFGGSLDSDRLSYNDNRGAATFPVTGAGSVQRGTKLVGMAVKNLQDDKIGSVDDLIIDLPAGRVVAVVVSSGGFLGLGDYRSVMPPSVIRFDEKRDGLRMDTTKEALKNAPRFKANEWPDFAQTDYTAGVYRAYNQEPYSRTHDLRMRDAGISEDKIKGRDVDNSGQNVRDRDSNTLTPANQGRDASDVKITQLIRKEVTAADALSTDAKNAKIITNHGRVTLRGPVRTADEKNKLAEIAARVAGHSNVDDQLEITAR